MSKVCIFSHYLASPSFSLPSLWPSLSKLCIFGSVCGESGVIINLASSLSFRHYSRAVSACACVYVCICLHILAGDVRGKVLATKESVARFEKRCVTTCFLSAPFACCSGMCVLCMCVHVCMRVCVSLCVWKGEKVHLAMMDHERPPFLMHTRTRQTPMRNEGERERERWWGNRVREEGERVGRVPFPPELINHCPLLPPSCTPTMLSSGVHQ